MGENGKKQNGNGRNTKKKAWMEPFLSQLRLSPSITIACEFAGIARKTAYAHRKTNPAFAQEWADAIEASVDRVEKALFDVAADMKHKGSVTAAIFLLKSHRPANYRETQRHQHEGVPDGEPIRMARQDLLAEPGYLAYLRQRASLCDGSGNGNGR